MDVVILISGSGTNMRAIAQAQIPGLNIKCVISNNSSAKGLEHAHSLGLNTEVVSSKGYKSVTLDANLTELYNEYLTIVQSFEASELKSLQTQAHARYALLRYNYPQFEVLRAGKRLEYDALLDGAIAKYNPDYIIMAGFMRILTPWFVEKWENKIVNIHPALLPAFKGAHAIRDALDFGARVTGSTVHFVGNKIDEGKIIEQSAVKISDHDNLETLTAKIKAEELKLYPAAIARLIVRGKHATSPNGLTK